MQPTNAIRSIIEEGQFRHYLITGNNGTSITSKDDPLNERSLEDVIQQFNKHFEMLSPGSYTFKGWKKYNGQKSADSYPFYKGDASPVQVAAIAGPSSPSVDLDLLKAKWELETKMERMLMEWKHEKELEKAKGGNDRLGSIIGMVEKFAPVLIAKMAEPNKAAIAAPPKPVASNVPSVEQSKAESALETLANDMGADNLVEVLETLADAAKRNPGTLLAKLNQAKAFL